MSKEQLTPEPLKAIKVFYIDPNWDLSWLHKSNDMRKDLFDICTDKAFDGYPSEVAEIAFRTTNLNARQQYEVGQVLKQYLNLDMPYWNEMPASLTRTDKHIVAKTYHFPHSLCTKELTTFEDGFDVYPYELRFRLDDRNKYSIRMAIAKEDS